MSAMTNTKKTGQGGAALSGLVCGAVAMMITLLLLLGASWLIASGKLAAKREDLMIMLSAFLGLLLAVLLLRPEKTGETLPFALVAVGSYIAILIVMEMAVGSVKLFGSNMLKLDVCAVVGTMLGITLKFRRPGQGRRRNRRRLYK